VNRKERKSTALLVIDMLNDFVLEGAPLEVEGAREIIPEIRGRIEDARRKSIPIIYICDNHAPDDAEFTSWPRHAVAGTRGSEVVAELAPRAGDRIVKKARYSGFCGTQLDRMLEELGVGKVTLTGVCTNICVLYTAVDALMRGFEVSVPEDSVAGLTPLDHKFALRQINEILQPAKIQT
jgi:nicotinamidase-related amidase